MQYIKGGLGKMTNNTHCTFELIRKSKYDVNCMCVHLYSLKCLAKGIREISKKVLRFLITGLR